MKILFACGGSGGHIAPAIAIAERLPSHQCFFVISDKHVDTVFSQKYSQFSFHPIHAKPFSKNPIGFFRFVKSQMSSYHFAKKFLNENSIDIVVSMGGFTSLGFAIAAKLSQIPLVLHETNIIAGKSTRFLSRIATKIILPLGSKSSLAKGKEVHIGYPVRQEFTDVPQEEARKQLAWPSDKKIILIVGGSNGAQILTSWARQSYQQFSGLSTEIFCIAGPKTPQPQSFMYEDCTLHILPFCNQMNLALRAADIVIARAGAGSIGEAAFCKKPMILIPYPFAADNHQMANALFAEQQGIAHVIPQNQIDTLLPYLLDLLKNPEKLKSIQAQLDQLPPNNAAKQTADLLESIFSKI